MCFLEGGLLKEIYQFYGESVIYSYLLESVISRFPIIVIDENTYDAIKCYSETSLLIKKDKNGRHYLNIFAPLCSEFSMNFNNEMFTIREINKEQVLENIKKNRNKFEYDAKNYEKFVFLLKEYEEYMEKLNIQSKEE